MRGTIFRRCSNCGQRESSEVPDVSRELGAGPPRERWHYCGGSIYGVMQVDRLAVNGDSAAAKAAGDDADDKLTF